MHANAETIDDHLGLLSTRGGTHGIRWLSESCMSMQPAGHGQAKIKGACHALDYCASAYLYSEEGVYDVKRLKEITKIQIVRNARVLEGGTSRPAYGESPKELITSLMHMHHADAGKKTENRD